MSADKTALLPAASVETRNVGGVYAFDHWQVRPALRLEYGVRLDRYDYIANDEFISPELGVRLAVLPKTAIISTLARRMVAPGAEEFLPPDGTGPWLARPNGRSPRSWRPTRFGPSACVIWRLVSSSSWAPTPASRCVASTRPQATRARRSSASIPACSTAARIRRRQHRQHEPVLRGVARQRHHQWLGRAAARGCRQALCCLNRLRAQPGDAGVRFEWRDRARHPAVDRCGPRERLHDLTTSIDAKSRRHARSGDPAASATGSTWAGLDGNSGLNARFDVQVRERAAVPADSRQPSGRSSRPCGICSAICGRRDQHATSC